MRRVLGVLAIGSLVLAGGLGAVFLEKPDLRFNLGGHQSFSPVPNARHPSPASAWHSSLRPLADPATYPELSDALQTQIDGKGGSTFPILVPRRFVVDDLAMAERHLAEALSTGPAIVITGGDESAQVCASANAGSIMPAAIIPATKVFIS